MDQVINAHNPLVSVILPVYNAEKYLRDAIRSVLDQTLNDFELLLIDDGSSDNSLAIMRSFTDSRIRIIQNDSNRGLIYSLNKGIEISKGKYIARMDADDLCVAERFEKQVDFLEKNLAVGICGSDYYNFSDHGVGKSITLKDKNVIRAWLLFSPPLCHPTVMFRASMLKNNHLLYDSAYKHVEDYELWTRAALITDIVNLQDFLLYYRDHAGQVSHQKREEQIANSKKVQGKYLGALGFAFTEDGLNIHNFISSNKRITSLQMLQDINGWLFDLVNQNSESNNIDAKAFSYAIGRIFYDCCGNTDLGFKAYRFWKNSRLKGLYKDTIKFRMKLLIKCLIRKFR